jgi:hypothetical protein
MIFKDHSLVKLTQVAVKELLEKEKATPMEMAVLE